MALCETRVGVHCTAGQYPNGRPRPTFSGEIITLGLSSASPRQLAYMLGSEGEARMRTILSAAICFLALPSVAFAQDAVAQDAKTQIQKYNDEMAGAINRGDPKSGVG